MKATMLYALTLLALPAFAQETKDTSAEWAAIAGPAAATPDQVPANVKAEVAKSEALTRKLSLDKQAALCKNRAKYDFDPEAVAKYIEDWTAEMNSIRAAALARMTEADKAATKANIADSKTVGPTTKEFTADVRSGVRELKGVLDALCRADTQEKAQ